MAPAAQTRLGLALGSGAARGLAHIGVLKVLEQEAISVDVIAGTSIGAFIGALYAAGVPIAQIEEVARNVDWRSLIQLIDPIVPTSGLIDGKKVSRFMAELLPAKTFEELHLPLAVVATDVETGELLTIRKGNLHEALRAAVAFPGIFNPVRFGNRFLVDGGLRNPVPVDIARQLGANRVIGVCAIPEVKKRPAETFLEAGQPSDEPEGRLLGLFNSQRVERLLKDLWPLNPRGEPSSSPADSGMPRKPPGIFRIFAQSVAIMENEINALRLEKNEIDLLIRPDLNDLSLLEFHRADEAIRAGEKATRAVMEQIRQLRNG